MGQYFFMTTAEKGISCGGNREGARGFNRELPGCRTSASRRSPLWGDACAGVPAPQPRQGTARHSWGGASSPVGHFSDLTDTPRRAMPRLARSLRRYLRLPAAGRDTALLCSPTSTPRLHPNPHRPFNGWVKAHSTHTKLFRI